MSKKILLVAMSLLCVAVLAVGGTLAYFTDTDSATNIMTLGGVSIEQNEYQRDENGNLVAFEDDKPLMPAVDTREDKTANPIVNGYFDPAYKNVVDKIVKVKNTASADAVNHEAYVRTILAFETNKEYAEGSSTEVLRDGKEIFHDYIGTIGSFTELERDTIVVDGQEYVLAVKVYADALAPQEESSHSLKQLFMSPEADNEISILFGEEYTVLALSQATQVAGFGSAEEALNEAFGDLETIDEATLVEWLRAVAD